MMTQPQRELEAHLRRSIVFALTIGLASCTRLVGTTPADLAEICDTKLLENISLDHHVDYIDLRKIVSSEFEVEVLWSDGYPCYTASDVDVCRATLAQTWPTGWGYCYDECTSSGLVTTEGDVVALYDSVDEVLTLLGDINTPAEALYVAALNDYTGRCDTLVERANGAYRFEATFLVSDCPWTVSRREIEVSTAGVIKMLREVSLSDSGGCAGRLPEGIEPLAVCEWDAVARRLAEFAWLEGAAVVAFEHLAEEMTELGAPADLITRARAAAADEVRHAATLGAFATAAGAQIPAVLVEPRQPRSLLAFALHNAQEGCVRETFGVVDAAFRAHRAPSCSLRSAFDEIAEDETRHAVLSWDIARWLETRLTAAECAEVRLARQQAHHGLIHALGSRSTDEISIALGGPSAAAAMQMAEALYTQFAA